MSEIRAPSPGRAMPPLLTAPCPAIYPPQAREIGELRSQLGLPRGAAAKELASVSFSLRGVDLAAMDINIVGKNSSDPYFLLYAVDASGQLKRLGKSNTLKASLNPTWEVLEVTSEALGGARRLKVLTPQPLPLPQPLPQPQPQP